jgi:baculoviral IAP repeat-containing protein 6
MFFTPTKIKYSYFYQQNPSSAFADVIQGHFWLKREEICDQIAAWIAEAAGSLKKHLTALNVI